MFNPPKKDEVFSPPVTNSSGATFIAKGVRLEGEFASDGNVTIEGEVNGHVTTGGELRVGAEAKMKVEITATEAVIAGTIEGNITIKKRLELKSTAKISGDLMCETLAIEAGAVLQGKVAVGHSSLAQKQTTNVSMPVTAATTVKTG